MRALTVRNAVRFGITAAVLGGLALTGGQAYAGDVILGDNAGGPNTSYGSASLKYEHKESLRTDIKTNFEPIDLKVAKVGVNVGVKIAPVTDGGPLFTVDMPKGANVEASWGTDKKILLRARTGSQSDGIVTVRHTLMPSINLSISGPFNAELGYDASQLINLIPGARFNYDSRAQQQFAPWGFNIVETHLNSPDLDRAVLFSMDMDQLPEFVANNVDGSFGVRATTKPTFSYKTTRVFISGATGELNDQTGDLVIPADDGDYIEVMTSVEGEMTVNGGITIQPFVQLKKIGQNIDFGSDGVKLGIDAYTQDYTTETQRLNFQTVLVHIPMPNVRVPSRGVNFGDVKVGGQGTKTIVIENTGEKDATMTFDSSEPSFRVPDGQVMVPAKGTYELTVKFNPENANPVKSDIRVMSNDADSPEQLFQVGANGADVGDPTENAANADSGCGCKTAGTSSSVPGYAGFGLLGLGAAVLFRRRRASRSAA